MEPANKKARVTTPTEHVPAPFRLPGPKTFAPIFPLAAPRMRLAWRKTLLYQLPQEVLEHVLRYTPPPASVKKSMDAVMAELEKVVTDCFNAYVQQDPPWDNDGTRGPQPPDFFTIFSNDPDDY